MKFSGLVFIFLAVISVVFAGQPIDLRQTPITKEMHLVAIDVQVNPTNMPDAALWDLPILLFYKQVPSFDNIRVEELREEIAAEFIAGAYQPVAIRTRQDSDLTLHLMNLIGTGESAPRRVVQGVVCKRCKKRAYTFSYAEGTDESMYPYLVSIHAHGIQYTIENDGTNAGRNPVTDPMNNGLIAPGEKRTYYYEKLDLAGVWPIHDHGNPSHSVARGLHMALIVEPKEERVAPEHDFLIIFSDYPEYDEYLDDFFAQLLIPPFIHMRNGNVMHAHALNGYAAMLAPRMNKAVANGGTKWDALRSDIVGDPRTPLFEVDLGDLVRFRLLSYGSATTTHSFHMHGHAWWDQASSRHIDSIAVPAGSSYELMFYAGGPPYKETPMLDAFSSANRQPEVRSGPGDWLYHCHIIPHVKHGMWGIFRVADKP